MSISTNRSTDERIHAITQIPKLNNTGQVIYQPLDEDEPVTDFQWLTDDLSVETWYSSTLPRSLFGHRGKTRKEMFSMKQLMKPVNSTKPEKHISAEFVNDAINLQQSYDARREILVKNEGLPEGLTISPHTVFIVDHATPVFDQSSNSAARLLCDREQQRAFLPIMREDMTDDGKFIWLNSN